MKITFNQIKTEVLRLMKKFPKNKYSPPKSDNPFLECSYTRGTCTNGKRGCLFGQALINLGIKRDELKIVGDSGLYYGGSKTIGEVLHEMNLNMSVQERNWVDNIQRIQDDGIAWGKILKKSE